MISGQLHMRLLENLSTAVVLLDENLCLSHINSAAEVLLALSGSRHVGEPIDTLLIDAEEVIAIFRETLLSSQSRTQREAHLNSAMGDEITVDYTVTPCDEIPDVALIIEIQPIDRLLRISREETIFSSQESTHALLKGMAHEIKNPLGGLRGAAQLLDQELNDDSLKEYTGIIIDEADRLTNLVDRMLGPPKPNIFSPINIHEVLERVSQLIDVEGHGSITIERDYDPSIPDFTADKERLIQATLNIVRNAFQSLLSSETVDPKISISTRILRHFTIGSKCHRLVCRIDISDNGPGIPEDLQDKVFIPMVSGNAKSSGLGLSISQSIINQHHGLIALKSKPGITCFSIYLPLEQHS